MAGMHVWFLHVHVYGWQQQRAISLRVLANLLDCCSPSLSLSLDRGRRLLNCANIAEGAKRRAGRIKFASPGFRCMAKLPASFLY